MKRLQNLYAYCGNNPVMYYDPSGYVMDECPSGGDFNGDGNGVPEGYYRDLNGKWHRPDGDFASNAEVRLPESHTSSSERGGRLGNEDTRAQNSQIADYLERQGYTITGGGGRGPEEFLAGPDGGTKGSNYLDVTATKDDETVRINTVDVYADGMTPTNREQTAANNINNKTGGSTILIPKYSGLGNLPDIISD